MGNIVSESLEDYCKEHSVQEHSLFAELFNVTNEKTNLSRMSVGHLQGSFLKMLVRLAKPKKILEIGTFTGYSALSMASALPEDGKLITCDINTENTKIAREYFDKSSYGNKIEIKLGPALHTLENLNEEFDFVFIDADKGNYINYWNESIKLLKTGGLIIVDNVLWSGRVLEPESKTDLSIAEFNDCVAKDDRAEVVMLTVRDGITLAYKL